MIIKKLCDYFASLIGSFDGLYYIPKLWSIDYPDSFIKDENQDKVLVDPFHFFYDRLQQILKDININLNYSLSLSNMNLHYAKPNWFYKSTIYGVLIRNFTAYDHNQDGILGSEDARNIEQYTVNDDSVRETGTFLKTIVLLPYLKKLGINTLYFLPVGEIGTADRKGELGSCYSIKNIFKIDNSLKDTLTELSAEEEFKALVEACHIMGIRVMLDFPLRTTSRDATWVKTHPDWYYWIDYQSKGSFTKPTFGEEQLSRIFEQVNNPNINQYDPPDKEYTEQFFDSPVPERVKYIPGEGYIAVKDGTTLSVPGAFADWPPNDIQPPWTDITYLKLHKNEEFNYIAYNTIRMYDERIDKPNQELWETLASVIPFYQNTFGIDGARLDMGHALPDQLEKSIIEKAYQIDKNFFLFSEDFNVKSDCYKSGYKGVWGNSWWMEPRINYTEATGRPENKFRELILMIKDNKIPIIATSETPDTPRAFARKHGSLFAPLSYFLNAFMKNGILYIQSGFEFKETKPFNLGLDFTTEYINNYKDKLALFDKECLSWSSDKHHIEWIQKINNLRNKYIHLISSENTTIEELKTNGNELTTLAYIFINPDIDTKLLVCVNFDFEHEKEVSINLEQYLNDYKSVVSLIEEEIFDILNGKLFFNLKPGDYKLVKIS